MIASINSITAADKTVKLPTPNMARTTVSVMQAFASRHSTREYSSRDLSLNDLSDLLWAADGYNRPAEQKRTAPSAMNRQEVEIYVILKEGTYLYEAKDHSLQLIATGDYRKFINGGQDFAMTAPVSLLLVADVSKFGDSKENRWQTIGAIDVGIVTENICLFCAAVNLAVVPRASMDTASLKRVLKLNDSKLLLMNTPVGYFKK